MYHMHDRANHNLDGAMRSRTFQHPRNKRDVIITKRGNAVDDKISTITALGRKTERHTSIAFRGRAHLGRKS